MGAPRIVRAGLAFAVVLTSLGAVPSGANHTTCTGQSNEIGTTTPCPEFSPDWRAKVSSYDSRGALLPSPVTFAPSSASFEFAGSDHESAVVEATYFMPKGWSFAFGQLQEESPGRAADGSLATTCAQVFDTAVPRRVARAEIVSASPRMHIRTSSGNGNRANAIYERAGSARSNVSFLRWSESTGIADLCLQFVTSTNLGDDAAEDLVLPVTVRRMTHRDFGWKITVDASPIFRNATLRNLGASVVLQTLHLNSLSAGNHHRNPLTGDLEALAFSRAPSSGVNGRFRGELTACRTGFDPSNLAAICRDGRTISVAHETIIPVTPAPKGQPLSIARLTGPTGLGSGLGVSPTSTAQYQGFGLVRGTDTAQVIWTQPSLPPDTYLKGYVVVIAKPNVQTSRVYRRVISDPAAPGFDAGAPPCGPDGRATTCSLSLRFPLTAAGGEVLYGDFVDYLDDGIYDIALITMYGRIYQEGTWLDDGRRSDGLCDDGTGPGALCDPTVAPPVLHAPGASYWRFQMRAAAWPQVFVQRGYAQTPDGYRRSCSCMPHITLLLDLPNHRAELTIWEQQTGGNKIGESTGPVPPGTWWGSSTLITGDARNGGTVVWGGVNAPFGFWGYVQGSSVRGRILISVRVDARGARGRILEFQGSRV